MNQMVQVEVVADAPPTRVFALLARTEGWTSWAGFDEAALEQPAPHGDPEGVGARRRFRAGRVRSREEVVAFEPDEHLGYVLLSGLPLRDYRGDVTLVPEGDGTRIRWRSTFKPRVPCTGWLYRRGLERFLRDTAGRLATYAARQAPA